MNIIRSALLLVLLIVLALILSHADWHRIRQSFVGIDWRWALLAPALNLLYSGIESTRMALILGSIKKGVRVKNAFAAVLLGFLGNTILPCRLGDGVRTYVLAKKENVSIPVSLSAVILDRIADVVLFFVLVALTSPFYPSHPFVKKLIFSGIVLLLAVIFASFFLVKSLKYFSQRYGGRYGRRISEEIDRFVAGLSAVKKSRLLIPIFFLSSTIWIIRGAIIWAMFKAFHMQMPLSAVAVTLIFLNIGISLVNTPGNFGPFEVATVAALKLFSVESGLALSYAISLHIIEHVPIVIVGVLIFWFDGQKILSMSKMKDLCSIELLDSGPPQLPEH